MNRSHSTVCSTPYAFNLLQQSCLILTSTLLQVQLFWSLRLGWSQHQYSSILHRSGKHRLAPSNIDKYQWLDPGECECISTHLEAQPDLPVTLHWKKGQRENLWFFFSLLWSFSICENWNYFSVDLTICWCNIFNALVFCFFFCLTSENLVLNKIWKDSYGHKILANDFFFLLSSTHC